MQHNVTWDEVEIAVNSISKWVKKLEDNQLVHFKGIWAPPRGGLIPAVMLSHKTGLKLFEEPRVRPLLIVDDIADTGKTLHSFSELEDVYIATLFYHKQSSLVPDRWVYEKKDAWIAYPWEMA